MESFEELEWIISIHIISNENYIQFSNNLLLEHPSRLKLVQEPLYLSCAQAPDSCNKARKVFSVGDRHGG